MGREVEQRDLAAVLSRHHGVRPAQPVLKAIAQPDGAVSSKAGENLAGEGLRDGADADHGVAIRLAGAVGTFPVAHDDALAVPDHCEHHSWDLHLQERDLSLEGHHVLQERGTWSRAGGTGRQRGQECARRKAFCQDQAQGRSRQERHERTPSCRPGPTKRCGPAFHLD